MLLRLICVASEARRDTGVGRGEQEEDEHERDEG
jgi:hypothetical protein